MWFSVHGLCGFLQVCGVLLRYPQKVSKKIKPTTTKLKFTMEEAEPL